MTALETARAQYIEDCTEYEASRFGGCQTIFYANNPYSAEFDKAVATYRDVLANTGDTELALDAISDIGRDFELCLIIHDIMEEV